MAESPILNFQDLYKKHCSEEITTRSSTGDGSVCFFVNLLTKGYTI